MRAVEEEEEEEEEEDMWLGYNLNKSYITHIDVLHVIIVLSDSGRSQPCIIDAMFRGSHLWTETIGTEDSLTFFI